MPSKTFAAALVTATVAAQNCNFTNEHSVTSLPYFSDREQLPCMNAGTLSSNADDTHHLFYWMYPNENPDAPLAIWLNGGPGASSSFANFLMNGPMRVAKTGDTEDDYLVYLTEEGSWSDIAHMVYLDQPVGTGFSFGEPLLTTMDEAADEFVNWMDSFFEMYPNFIGHDLYITGESYAGKYIPRFSYALLEANKERGNRNFNLRASLVGDPYTAPLTQRTHMHLVPEALNVLDDSNMDQIAAMERRCREIIAVDLEAADDECANIMGYIEGVSGDVFPYDQRIFGYDWDPKENIVTAWLNNSTQAPALWEAIHVSDSTKVPMFEMSSGTVGSAFVMDNLLDYSWYFEELIRQKLPLLIYAGEFDAQDGPKTQEYWLRRMSFEGSEDFWDQSRQTFWVEKANSDDLIVGGYWRESEFFSYLTVPKAGHFVPANYYRPSFQFFQDYLEHQRLQCHNTDGDCSVVDFRCEAMNNCSGHGACGSSNGKCACERGWKGADCAVESNHMSDGDSHSFKSTGDMTYSFTVHGQHDANMHLNSQQPMNVWVSSGARSDPNQFHHEMSFLNVSHVVLRASDLHLGSDWSVTVDVTGINEPDNKLLNNELKVSLNARPSADSLAFFE